MARLHPPMIAGADESRRRDLVRSSGLFVAYALVTVWWSWPGIWNWSTKVAYSTTGFANLQHADFYLITWTLSWVSHALATNPAALFDGNTFFPAKLSVAYSEHLLGYVPLFAPVYWTTGNPILALNVTGALTYPLAGLFMYRFARLYMHDTAAALSGLFYAFTLARYVAPPHFQCLGSQYFPLIPLATEQWLRRAEPRYALLLFVALTLQSLSSVYFLYAVFLMVCPYAVAAAWHHRATLDRRRIAGLAAAGVAAGCVVAASMWPYLILRAQGLVTSYDDQHTALGLVPVLATKFLTQVLFQLGIGWIGYGLAVAGALFARDAEARWPRRLGLLLLAVGILAAFGPRIVVGGVNLWSPYVLLRDYLPGFATIRLPGRLAVIAHLGFALLAGLGAEQILRRARPRVAALAAVATAVTTLALMLPFPALPLHDVPVRGAVPPAYRWLREHGRGRAVLELPAGGGADRSAYRAYLSTAHWQPIVEGYAGNAPTHWRHIQWIALGLPETAALQRVVDVVDIGWLLVHRDQLEPALAERWANAQTDGLELAGEWAGDVLYRVTLPPRDDHRARLLSTAETLNGVRIESIAAGCAGALGFDGWAGPPDVPGEWARAHVVISNHSPRAWPALGFLPRNLVALEVRITSRDGRPLGESWQIGLNDDVLPDRPLPVYVPFTAPRAPGRYTLRLRLIQTGMPSLDRCVTPLEVAFELPDPQAILARSNEPAAAPPP